ncbi:nitrate- and nitrite sensing domain-containing protein [Micromonospora sp. WMMD956]|uniref:sensor histidine kinase n=1 Tax=Micromonospora sp. WMMD956 TaxID=3016108 RepID=UPI0024166CEC|nr:nitrate- and nitrite sensing domain-containing protein [Micromonospora sp. WMMD956]MDG4815737.1 nitrate- and nitrite sensing domain-containing protein [Micromonospora sp. WMMD956]
MLARLRIRGKLALLVIVPLLSMVGLAVPIVLDRVATAGRAADTAEAVRVASRVGTLVQDLQQERLLSVGLLLGRASRTEVIQKSATVDDRVADIRAELGGQLTDRVRLALDQVRGLADVRAAVLAGRATPVRVMEAFGPLAVELIDSLRLAWKVDTTTPVGQQVLALDGLLRADESLGACATLIVLVKETSDPKAIASYIACMAALTVDTDRFRSLVTPEQLELALLDDAAVAARTGPTFIVDSEKDPVAALSSVPLDTLFPSVQSMTTLGQFVEKKIAADVTTQVREEEQRALTAAWVVGVTAVLVMLLVVLLSMAVARLVARPLTRLTRSAERVARAAEAELVRVADDESENVPPIRLDPVDVRGRDEIGDLARAFERVQSTAARLVERQVAGRRNVAQMFGHVGRRTQNLVGRQIALIDRLEQQETDPGRLEHLYRLDHVSSRLRRNAGSLVVLSGSTGADGHVAPVPLTDVVRLALGEIEDYTRVDVQVPAGVSAAPSTVGDLVLALAELMENATVFSPPHTRVVVTAEPAGHGMRLSVVDHGIGMTEERLAEENARLTRRERLDLVPTEVLGLFVVGRLARRHGWTVDLVPTTGGGVTARLEVPSALLVVPPAGQAGQPATGTAAPDRPAASGRPQPTGPGRALAVAATAHPAPAGGPGDGSVDGTVALGVALGVDRELLSRATRSMESGDSWNAFEAVVEPPAATSGRAGAPTLDAPPTVGGTPVAPDAAAPPAAPGAGRPSRAAGPVGGAAGTPLLPARPRGLSFPTGPQPGSAPPGSAPPPGGSGGTSRGASGIRQRVPGASLPHTGPVVGPVDATTADPAAARALVEQFEAGVRRAELHPPAAPPMPARPAVAPPTPGRPVPTPPTPGRPAAAPPGAAAPVAAPLVADPPRLTRRVPGANLAVPPPRPAPPSDPGDPAEVRDLINQFEAGVARALREARPDRRYEEGSTR